MKRRIFQAGMLAFALLLTGAASLAPRTDAQSGDGYSLTWSTVDGGGAMPSTGGAYSLGGKAGQPHAGVLAGGGYTLSGGFWSGAAPWYRVQLPLVLRGP